MIIKKLMNNILKYNGNYQNNFKIETKNDCL